MQYEQLVDVGESRDFADLERRLVAVAHAMEFPIISGALIRGRLHDAGVQIASLGNTPPGFVDIAKDLAETRRDPVMAKLMKVPTPIIYDQSTYVTAGAGELWEAQAPFGYKTGIAVKLHLPGDKHFLLGVDREDPLPPSGPERMRVIGALQLLAVHTVTVADRLLSPKLTCSLPHLTNREMDVLTWTARGKTAWEVAALLRLGEKTVNFHLRNVMLKLGVKSKHHAVLKCIAAGVLTPPDDDHDYDFSTAINPAEA